MPSFETKQRGGRAARLSSANVADIGATTTALLEEAERVQGMWMQLTGWQEKSVMEKVIYMMETPVIADCDIRSHSVCCFIVVVTFGADKSVDV